MKLKLELKFEKALDVVTGEGRNGTWKKQDFVCTTIDSEYEDEICFTVFNKDAMFNMLAKLKQCDIVTVYFSVKSRMYNDRYFSNINAFSIECEKLNTAPSTANVPPEKTKTEPVPKPEPENNEGEDDLPF